MGLTHFLWPNLGGLRTEEGKAGRLVCVERHKARRSLDVSNP
jgi:hypothetical protein